jgi:hypothetical protein
LEQFDKDWHSNLCQLMSIIYHFISLGPLKYFLAVILGLGIFCQIYLLKCCCVRSYCIYYFVKFQFSIVVRIWKYNLSLCIELVLSNFVNSFIISNNFLRFLIPIYNSISSLNSFTLSFQYVFLIFLKTQVNFQWYDRINDKFCLC